MKIFCSYESDTHQFLNNNSSFVGENVKVYVNWKSNIHENAFNQVEENAKGWEKWFIMVTLGKEVKVFPIWAYNGIAIHLWRFGER